MSQYSPYAVSESEPPTWKPGEETAAAAFIGIALWLVLDTNICIIRVFKKKRGLYYWSVLLGMSGCALDAIGVILKYLTPGTAKIWPLYTLLLLGGWGTYAPAQLLVLYSRLHLVNNIPKVHRWVLGSIISTLFIFVLPTWVVIWHSYNPDVQESSLWSPRNAIIERYTQIGFTLVECIVSGVYVWSLLGLLNHKSTVRQRRVMVDLIYVNVIVVAFDILIIIFIYLNQLGISHPIQTFSYALKLKLEFVVLNQLMAVAARGIQRHSWEERRYHNADTPNDFSAECRRWAEQSGEPPLQADARHEEPPDYDLSGPPAKISQPQSAMTRSHRASTISRGGHGSISPTDLENVDFGDEPKLEFQSFYDDAESRTEASSLHTGQNRTFSGETLPPDLDTAREESPHLLPRRSNAGKKKIFQSIQQRLGHSEHKPPISRKAQPVNATLRRPKPGRCRNNNDEDDDQEEIGVHMWENRGKLILDAPWFKTKEGV